MLYFKNFFLKQNIYLMNLFDQLYFSCTCTNWNNIIKHYRIVKIIFLFSCVPLAQLKASLQCKHSKVHRKKFLAKEYKTTFRSDSRKAVTNSRQRLMSAKAVKFPCFKIRNYSIFIQFTIYHRYRFAYTKK